MSVAHNKQIVLDMKAAFNRSDWNKVLDFLTEDIRYYTIGSTRYSGLFVGRDVFWEKKLKPMVDQMDDSGFAEEIIRIVGEDDIVVVESRGRETLRNGKPYCNEYCMVYRIRDDKISEWTSYLDTMLIAETHA